MKRHYELAPLVWHEKPLVFDWDDETGEVSGPDAGRIREMASGKSVRAHPCPWAWDLGPEPLKSKTDMAAIVGYWWRLPPDLAPYYPKCEPTPPIQILDENGNVIGEEEVIH